MKIILVSKCSLAIELYVEFKMSVLISPSKSLISSCWVTNKKLIKKVRKHSLDIDGFLVVFDQKYCFYPC